MDHPQDRVFKFAGIGAMVVCVALVAFMLLMVLSPAFIGTTSERFTYLTVHPGIGALPWIAAVVWATAEIPVVLGLLLLTRSQHPDNAILGTAFYFISIAVRFVAYAILIATMGGVSRGEITSSSFAFLETLGLTLEGVGLLLLSVALLLFGFSLAAQDGLLRRVIGWLFTAAAASLLLGGPEKMLISIGIVFPATVDIIATVLLGPIPVALAIVANALLIPVFIRH